MVRKPAPLILVEPVDPHLVLPFRGRCAVFIEFSLASRLPIQVSHEDVNIVDEPELPAAYEYDLSKRTALYSSVTRFKNDGVGYVDRAAGIIPVGLTDASHRDLTEVVAGIRHSF